MTDDPHTDPRATAPLSPRTRLTLWWALLAAYSLQDLILTSIALQGVPGAREMNPLADLAFEQSILAAAGLKILALTAVLVIVWRLARTKHWPVAERVLVAWCIVILAVNAYSALQILGGI
jgi:hypothetical protein